MSLLGVATPVSDVSGSRSTPATDTGGTFVAVNPTPGTGIAGAVAITLAAAKLAPSMVIFNGNVAGPNPVNIYPLYLKLTETVASTTGTASNFQFYLDVINRLASGNSATTLLTIANTASASATKSNAVINYGPLVSPTPQADRPVSMNLQQRQGLIDVVGDHLEFNWGGPTLSNPTAFLTTATIGNFQFGLQATAIAPGQSLVLLIWKTSVTVAATYEIEFGYIER